MGRRGFTLLAVLLVATIVVVIILGVNKSLMHFSKNTSRLALVKDLSSMQRVVTKIIRSDFAWASTVYKSFLVGKSCLPGRRFEGVKCPSMSELLVNSLSDKSLCFPGAKKRTKSGIELEDYCPFDFYYNPSKPDDIDSYLANGHLKRWICNYSKDGKNIKGIGFLVSGGMPLYLEDVECTSDPEASLIKNRPQFKDSYIKVNVYPPDPAAAGYSSLPTFRIELEDVTGGMNKKRFFIW